MATFQDVLAESLQGFGITMDPSEIPESGTAASETMQVLDWINGLDSRTRAVLWYAGGDIATGMWNQGFFQQWPALYRVAQENQFDGFLNTYQNIHTCIQYALAHQDDHAGLAGDGTGIDSIPGAAGTDASADPYATP